MFMFLSLLFFIILQYCILSKIDVSFIFIMELAAIVEIVKLYVFTDTCVIIYGNTLLSTKCGKICVVIDIIFGFDNAGPPEPIS